MNRIGVSDPNFGKTPFPEVFEQISKNFGHWEIFSEMYHSVQKVSPVFHELVDSYDMTFSIHTAIADINVAAINDRIREASVAELVSEMEVAVEMGVDTLTVHPGIYSLCLRNVQEKSIAQAKRSMKTLDIAAKEYGLTVCIENMPQMPGFDVMLGKTANELESIIEGTDLPVCFDIGHAYTNGQVDAMIDTFGDRIRNIHIHDNHGQRDEHLTIGDGDIEFEPLLKKLSGYKGRFIIESKSMESALLSQERLKALLQ